MKFYFVLKMFKKEKKKLNLVALTVALNRLQVAGERKLTWQEKKWVAGRLIVSSLNHDILSKGTQSSSFRAR